MSNLSDLDAMYDLKPRIPAAFIAFRDDPELFFALDSYRRSIGWTWKRLFLVGMADTILKNGDNPDLAVHIANYISGRR